MEFLPKDIAVELFGDQAYQGQKENYDLLIDLYRRYSQSPTEEGDTDKQVERFKKISMQLKENQSKLSYLSSKAEGSKDEMLPDNSLVYISNNNEVLSYSKKLISEFRNIREEVKNSNQGFHFLNQLLGKEEKREVLPKFYDPTEKKSKVKANIDELEYDFGYKKKAKQAGSIRKDDTDHDNPKTKYLNSNNLTRKSEARQSQVIKISKLIENSRTEARGSLVSDRTDSQLSMDKNRSPTKLFSKVLEFRQDDLRGIKQFLRSSVQSVPRAAKQPLALEEPKKAEKKPKKRKKKLETSRHSPSRLEGSSFIMPPAQRTKTERSSILGKIDKLAESSKVVRFREMAQGPGQESKLLSSSVTSVDQIQFSSKLGSISQMTEVEDAAATSQKQHSLSSKLAKKTQFKQFLKTKNVHIERGEQTATSGLQELKKIEKLDKVFLPDLAQQTVLSSKKSSLAVPKKDNSPFGSRASRGHSMYHSKKIASMMSPSTVVENDEVWSKMMNDLYSNLKRDHMNDQKQVMTKFTDFMNQYPPLPSKAKELNSAKKGSSAHGSHKPSHLPSHPYTKQPTMAQQNQLSLPKRAITVAPKFPRKDPTVISSKHLFTQNSEEMFTQFSAVSETDENSAGIKAKFQARPFPSPKNADTKNSPKATPRASLSPPIRPTPKLSQAFPTKQVIGNLDTSSELSRGFPSNLNALDFEHRQKIESQMEIVSNTFKGLQREQTIRSSAYQPSGAFHNNFPSETKQKGRLLQVPSKRNLKLNLSSVTRASHDATATHSRILNSQNKGPIDIILQNTSLGQGKQNGKQQPKTETRNSIESMSKILPKLANISKARRREMHRNNFIQAQIQQISYEKFEKPKDQLVSAPENVVLNEKLNLKEIIKDYSVNPVKVSARREKKLNRSQRRMARSVLDSSRSTQSNHDNFQKLMQRIRGSKQALLQVQANRNLGSEMETGFQVVEVASDE